MCGSGKAWRCLFALFVLAVDGLGLLERIGLGRFGVVAHPVDPVGLVLVVVGLGEGVLLLFVGVGLGHLVALHTSRPTLFRARPQRRARDGLRRLLGCLSRHVRARPS